MIETRYVIQSSVGSYFSPHVWGWDIHSAVLFVSREVAVEAQKMYCRGFTTKILTVDFVANAADVFS